MKLDKAYEIYLNTMEKRKDEDYIENPPQMEKFLKLIDFLKSYCNDDDKILIESNPKKVRYGGVTAKFYTFDVNGKEKVSKFLNEFVEVFQCVSAFGVDATLDGIVEISVTVPDIYIHKSEVKN